MGVGGGVVVVEEEYKILWYDFRIGQELKIKSPKEWLSQFENKKICAPETLLTSTR